MNIRQWLQNNPSSTAEDCAAELGVDVRSVNRKIYSIRSAGGTVAQLTSNELHACKAGKPQPQQPATAVAASAAPAVKRSGASDRVKEFREKYDKAYIIPSKVQQVITDWLSQNSVVWAEDVDMQKKCGINNPADWKTFARENSDFHQYHVTGRGGKVIWCRAADRDKLQEMVLLR